MQQAAPSTRKLMKLAESAAAKGRGPEAVQLYQQVLALNPAQADALYGIGFIRHSIGDYAVAAEFYQRAIQADPQHVASYSKLCKVLEAANRGTEAIELAYRATQQVPGDPKTHAELVAMLLRFNQSHRVPEYLEGILPQFPNDLELAQFYCLSLKINHRRAEAHVAYAALLKRQRVPAAFRILFETYMPRLPISNAEIDAVRAEFAEALERFIAEKPRVDLGAGSMHPLFQLGFHNRDNKAIAQRYTAMRRLISPELNFTAPHVKQPPRADGSPIRIGFLSRHMHAHSVGNCYRGVMLHLAAQPEFSVTLFTPSAVMDAQMERIAKAGVPIVSLSKNLVAAQKEVAAHGLDILIYPDIGMDATTHYLAMARLARYQCCMHGHPDTTGIDTIDYYISTRSYEAAGAQALYTETLLCLNSIDTMFERPAVPQQAYSREELGLPVDKKLYVCPMAIQKFHPDFDGICEGILARDPQAVIVLFSDFQQQMASVRLTERILARCDAARVIFLAWQPFDRLVSILKTADAVLDTLYFGAGTTSQIAFSFGVPIVTLPGTHTRGRIVQAYYRLMGITDAPVAENVDGYITTAMRLAHDAEYRAELSKQLLARNHVLFDDRACAPLYVQLMHDIMAQDLARYAP
ncbi:MAG: tetratricopeptide repeat protein [Pseudomonadota bacterium]